MATPVGYQTDVLPVFYYNDMLVRQIGDPVGLNLFEPRYVDMCRRMQAFADPRFVFLPNYVDYQCKTGDVGFIVRVTDLSARGGQYGIQGTAEEMVAVACTWVDPSTHGLHYTRFWKIDHRVPRLPFQALQMLGTYLEQHGWERVENDEVRRQYDKEGARLLVGCNWRRDGFLLALQDAEDAARPSEQRLPTAVKTAARPATPLSVIQEVHDMLTQSMHGVPAVTSAVGLDAFLQRVFEVLRLDGRGTRWVVGLQEDAMPDLAACERFLKRARLAAVGAMFADMPTVRLTLAMARGEGGQPVQVACIKNGSNVLFYSVIEEVRITNASAKATLAEVEYRLNRPRLVVLQRSHARGSGRLSLLRDDVLNQIYDYICTRPDEPL